jgi:hypothetical protein
MFRKFLNTGTNLDYQDNNQPIECTWDSPWEFLGEAGILKNFSSIRLYSSESVGSQFTLGIEIETNFAANNTISQCTIQNGAAGYGLSPYGSSAYGDPSDAAPKHRLSVGRVRAAKVIFTNDEAQTNVAITGYELEIAAPYKPVFKS